MNKNTAVLKILALAAVILTVAGCNTLSKQEKSGSIIVLQSLTGKSYAGDDVAFLDSDVIGTDTLVRADTATAHIVVRLINPDSISGPSQFNDVVLTNYTVTYELPLGGGTPGTDVPFPFDGNFSTVLCPVDEEVSVPFVVVLEAAKLSAPLLALRGTVGTVLERKAKIDIYGHDLNNHEVSTSGYLTIYFADYQDTIVAAIKK